MPDGQLIVRHTGVVLLQREDKVIVPVIAHEDRLSGQITLYVDDKRSRDPQDEV